MSDFLLQFDDLVLEFNHVAFQLLDPHCKFGVLFHQRRHLFADTFCLSDLIAEKAASDISEVTAECICIQEAFELFNHDGLRFLLHSLCLIFQSLEISCRLLVSLNKIS